MATLNSNNVTTYHTGTVQKGLAADWQHAARLFNDGNHRLAPRSKYNFFVKFNMINTYMLSSYFNNTNIAEVGMLVKGVNLPSYTLETTTKNQYNRKKIAYKNIKYDPVTITMHDDSDGVTNALWSIYFDYYCADTNNPSIAYQQNWYRPINTPLDGFRFGLDNDISTPMFRSIELYTMSRGKYLGYTLINPKITNWKHGEVDHSSSEMLDSKMTVEFESVQYSGGSVSELTYSSYFGSLHYDQTASPISSISSTQVTNPDGLESMYSGGGLSGIINGLVNGAMSSIATGVINNIAAPIATSVINSGISLVNNIATNAALGVAASNSLSGTAFPLSNSASPVQYISQATQTNLIGSNNAQ
jgi:hypothetical protein